MGSAPKPQPLPPAPPPAADLTDQAVRDAQAAARNQQLAGAGRRSTFLTAGGGQSAPAPGIVKTATDPNAKSWDFGLEGKGPGDGAVTALGGGKLIRGAAVQLNQKYAADARKKGTY